MQSPNATEARSLETLDRTLDEHAENSLRQSPSNRTYAETTRLRAIAARTMITAKSGEVRGVAISWMDEIQPVAEIVFGADLDGEKLGTFREYTPTVFEGVYGRTRILSTDEMLGPTISLDLAAEDSLH